MTTERGRTIATVLAAFLASPPGWIPAWATATVVLIFGKALIVAAVGSEIELARIAAAKDVFAILADVYKATLGIWLGYKGLRALPELIVAVRSMRRGDELPPPKETA